MPQLTAQEFIESMDRKNKIASAQRVPTAYIAGPYRSSVGEWGVKQNIAHAERVAMEVRKLGAYCYVPHANSAFCGGTLPDDYFLNEGLNFLRKCDFVVVFGGWENSDGTKAEISLAESLGMPIFFFDHFCCGVRILDFIQKY